MKSSVSRACSYLISIALMLASSYALAFDMGALNSYLKTGTSGSWTISDARGSLVMENGSAPGAIRYYFVNTKPDLRGRRTVSVKVSVRSRQNGHAGLFYGLIDGKPRSYFIFTSDGRGNAVLYYRGPDGYEKIKSFPIKGGEVTLAIQERGRGIALFTNGQEREQMFSKRLGYGGIGILASGIGSYRMTGFDIDVATDKKANKRPRKTVPPTARQPERQPQPQSRSSDCSDGLQMKVRRDAESGMVTMHAPMPDGWEFVQKNPQNLAISGPDVNIYQYPIGSFAWGKSPSGMKTVRASNLRPVLQPMPIAQYLKQRIEPEMQGYGYRLLQSGPLPGILSKLELIGMMMPQLGNRRTYQVLGTEWQSNDGKRLFKLVTLTKLESQDFIAWDMSVNDVQSPNRLLSFARDSYLCAYRKTEVNPQWVIKLNNKLLANIRKDRAKSNRKMAQIQAAHAQRMNAIAQRGNATRAIGKTYSDILDISHSGFLKRSDMVSAGQAKSVDYHAGRSVIFNPDTGERFKVDAGNKHYWINNQGEYFGTDNPNLDPRTDRRFNDNVWTNTQVVR